MRRVSPSLLLVGSFLVALPGAARTLPEFDAFAALPPARRALARPAEDVSRPGMAVHIEERLGVPTFLRPVECRRARPRGPPPKAGRSRECRACAPPRSRAALGALGGGRPPRTAPARSRRGARADHRAAAPGGVRRARLPRRDPRRDGSLLRAGRHRGLSAVRGGPFQAGLRAVGGRRARAGRSGPRNRGPHPGRRREPRPGAGGVRAPRLRGRTARPSRHAGARQEGPLPPAGAARAGMVRRGRRRRRSELGPLRLRLFGGRRLAPVPSPARRLGRFLVPRLGRDLGTQDASQRPARPWRRPLPGLDPRSLPGALRSAVARDTLVRADLDERSVAPGRTRRRRTETTSTRTRT